MSDTNIGILNGIFHLGFRTTLFYVLSIINLILQVKKPGLQDIEIAQGYIMNINPGFGPKSFQLQNCLSHHSS